MARDLPRSVMHARITAILGIAVAAGLLIARAALPPAPAASLGSFGRGPTVVLVHGLGSRPEHWLPMARDLARDHRVVLVELPGHGLADMPARLTIEEAALALDRAIAGQGAGPVVLVGHSVGGLVAVAEALHAPRRVRSLVLVETALRPQLSPADRADLLSALERDYRGTLRQNYCGFGRDSAQGAQLFAQAAQIDSTILKAWIRLAVTTDLSDRVAALRVPVLAVLSERSWPDGESWRSCADTLGYAALAQTTPVRVPGVGHFIMLDRPRLLADMIRRFAEPAGQPVVAMR